MSQLSGHSSTACLDLTIGPMPDPLNGEQRTFRVCTGGLSRPLKVLQQGVQGKEEDFGSGCHLGRVHSLQLWSLMIIVIIGRPCLPMRPMSSSCGAQLCSPARKLGTVAPTPLTWEGEWAASEIACRASLQPQVQPSTGDGHGRLVALLFPSVRYKMYWQM